MKKIAGAILIVGLTTGLIGCASNTQSQNTMIGATAGAVVGGLAGGAVSGGQAVGVGVGAVVGALAGGMIGQSMDSSDNSHMYSAVSSGHGKTWVNTKTHTTFTIMPGKYIVYNGNPHCRKYVLTMTTPNNKMKKMHGIVCRQSDGSWRSM